MWKLWKKASIFFDMAQIPAVYILNSIDHCVRFKQVINDSKYFYFTLNIKQEYMLQFFSLNIDSDVWRQISVMSIWTISVAKQTPDVTYRKKNGDVAGALNCHFTLTWPNLLYPHSFFDWLAIWTFLGNRPRFRKEPWYSECSTQDITTK